VLIVDDDSDVRELIRTFLMELGYEVRAAAHSETALAMLREFNPNLLVLDFSMPGMNGADLAVVARRQNPGLGILFVSGFADSAELNAAVGSAPLLRKPFRPGELAAAVRSALDASRAAAPDRQ
jgi:DNA-binding response OmpR family regulator